jgi:hypothetical protein
MPLIYRTSPFQRLLFAILSITFVTSFLSNLRARIPRDDESSHAKAAIPRDAVPKSNGGTVKQSNSRFEMKARPQEVPVPSDSFKMFRDPFNSTRTVFYGLLNWLHI